MTTRSEPLKATVWMIGAMVSFSLMAVSGRELATSLNTFEIMLYRSIIGLLIVLVIGFLLKPLMKLGVTALVCICSETWLIFLDKIYGF